ncbi:MAG TPA: CbiX/SirB N-terminal domain-containing protein [Longimicrobiales bacterium]
MTRGSWTAGALAALLAVAPASAQQSAPRVVGAPGSDADPPRAVGTIVVAHGAGPEWNAQVQEVARRAQTGGPVEVSFLMGPGAKAHRFQDAAKRLAEAGVREIVVVPLLISSHSGHYEQIRWLAGETDTLGERMLHHLHMAGIERPDVDVPMRVTPAIDGAPEIAGILAEHALALAKEPAAQALFLIGHGPNSAEDYAAWMEDLRPLADSVKAATGFRDVKVGLVQDDAAGPVRAEAVRRIREIITLQHQVTGRPVVVVPVLIGTGPISLEKFPADLAGLPIAYDGKGLVPHPALARWIEARVGAGQVGLR